MDNNLFKQNLKVVNVGLSSFADSVRQGGGEAAHVEWSPPAQADRRVGLDLAKLINSEAIRDANEQAYNRFLAARPVLKAVGTARDTIPGMGDRMLLHAGPPIQWEAMCGPMQGAVIGAILYEGWAANHEDARTLAASGEITFDPCHHHQTVGPMAGLVCPSMPVWVIENPEHGNLTFSTMNEGIGKALRFGSYEPAVLDRLKWMQTVLGPAMGRALEVLGGIDLKPVVAQALHMGDECHNRNVAATSLIFKKLAPALLKTSTPASDSADALDFIARTDHFFVNISMATCKSMLDAAHNIPNSTMVTVMARNGVEFGIRLSGTGDTWFTAPAPAVEGLFFTGFTAADAARDMGDSAITETAGIGGFAMGAAPAIVQFIGGTPQDAIAYTREMEHITLGNNGNFTLPQLNFRGSPSGIDARKVVDTGIAPVINTGIAHRDAGVGQVGAGITRAPLSCFIQAIEHFAKNATNLD